MHIGPHLTVRPIDNFNLSMRIWSGAFSNFSSMLQYQKPFMRWAWPNLISSFISMWSYIRCVDPSFVMRTGSMDWSELIQFIAWELRWVRQPSANFSVGVFRTQQGCSSPTALVGLLLEPRPWTQNYAAWPGWGQKTGLLTWRISCSARWPVVVFQLICSTRWWLTRSIATAFGLKIVMARWCVACVGMACCLFLSAVCCSLATCLRLLGVIELCLPPFVC